MVLVGAFQSNTWVAMLALTGVILGAAYMLWLYRRVIFGDLTKENLKSITDLNWREVGIFAPLVSLALVLGSLPGALPRRAPRLGREPDRADERRPIFRFAVAPEGAPCKRILRAGDAAGCARGAELGAGRCNPSSSRTICPRLPELFLAGASVTLLMAGVFIGDRSTRLMTWLACVAMAAAFVMVLVLPDERTTTFFGLFVVDRFAAFMKCLVLVGAAVTLIVGLGYVKREGMNRFEFPVLIVFATLGMLLMISANDLIALYVGLELQSLSLYIVAAFRRDSLRSTEAGLKYFVLGAISSGLLLYGCSHGLRLHRRDRLRGDRARR